MTFDELKQEALKLSLDERVILAHFLRDSVEREPVDPEIERAWIEEAERRLRELEEGKVKAIPGEEAIARLRASLDAKRKR